MGGAGGGAHRRARWLRGVLLVAPLSWALLGPAPGGYVGQARANTLLSGADTSRAVPQADSPAPTPGRRLTTRDALTIAGRLTLMRKLVHDHAGAFAGAYLKASGRWQVSYFTRDGRREIGQVLISDHGRVLEQWTGPQVAWTMARGYPGAFGEHLNALYVWIPLSLLFLVPFVRWRRLLSLRHLDLLALSLFSVSLAFFNHGNVAGSVPLSYPPLVYLLVRMLMVARVGRRAGPPAGAPEPLLTLPLRFVGVGVVVLVAFRLALNVTDANVVDVGYAGVIGGHRVLHGQALYGHWPADNPRGDTYGPVAYEAYVPFVALLGWSGRWDDLPAAHAAAALFDLLAVGLCFVLGRRARGPPLGIALAYAWAASPFTLFALSSNTNDGLVAVLVLSALLVGTVPARGAFASLAALTKFAPLALAPLLASIDLRGRARAAQLRALAVFLSALALVGALSLVPALAHASLHTIFQRTLVYQSHRDSPFSVWGLYGGMHGAQLVVQAAGALLAIAIALVPRRRDLVGTAAAAAAVVIAVQLGLDHWFYSYIPWFFAPLMLAVLAGGSLSPVRAGDEASAPGQSSRLVAA